MRNPQAIDEQRILTVERPPVVAATNVAEIAVAERVLRNLDPRDLRERVSSRFVDANALPWLTGSSEGRNFLKTPPQRVLVRGNPASNCPIALVERAPPSQSIASVAGAALGKCLEQAPPGCGCRVVAVGSVLLLPRVELAYATGISARIRVQALDLDALLVAEETKDGDLILRDLSGVVARVTRGPGDQVALEFAEGGDVYRGTSRAVGYRRGRIAERLYLRNDNGARLSLLLGFEPDELAEIAGGWLAWPPDA